MASQENVTVMVARSTPANYRRSGPKSKRGCRTCKLRKVRCDMGRPVCQKCSLTGRTCDGYGIWGGGNADPYRANGITSYPTLITKKLSSIPGLKAGTETSTLDWFLSRTTTKVAGVFGTGFWSSLVLQTIQSEPAVLHAALALSSAHRSTPSFEQSSENCPDKNEQFLLQHYSESVVHLQPPSLQQGRSSIRIALVACILFSCLEFLRGRYETGRKHLLHGSRLLEVLHTSLVTIDDPRCVIDDGLNDDIDNWLGEALSRLSFPTNFLGNGIRPHIPRVRSVPPPIFQSLAQARRMLDSLFEEVLDLSEDCTRRANIQLPIKTSAKIKHAQQQLRVALSSWHKAHTVSRVKLQTEVGALGLVAYQTLACHQCVAVILLETCVEPSNQLCFDEHIPIFLSILRRSIDIFVYFLTLDLSNTPFAHRPDIPPFVADRSFLLPLYFTAIKCRNHRIRLHAIKLLRAVASREGIIDALLFSEIASEVMRIEESDFYAGTTATSDDFAREDVPKENDLDLPVLPDKNRLKDVTVLLPDGPKDCTTLICLRGNCTTRRKYNPTNQSWHNV